MIQIGIDRAGIEWVGIDRVGIVSIPKKSKNKQVFIDQVRNYRFRYDQVKNDLVR